MTDPRKQCTRCDRPGWRLCPTCRGEVDWKTDCWAMSGDYTKRGEIPEACEGCGKALTENAPDDNPVYEVQQTPHEWPRGKKGKAKPRREKMVRGFACSVECARVVDVKIGLMREG